jgi:hypothetical protein
MKDTDLAGFYDPLPPPDSWRNDAERRELLRIAATNALRNNPDRMHPDGRRWAEHWSKIPPLGRPMGTDEPAPAHLPEGQP